MTRSTAPGTITAVERNTARLTELAEAGFTTAALDLADAAGVAELISTTAAPTSTSS